VLESLIGSHAPRALNAIDQTPAVYLSECIKSAELVDQGTMRHYAGRIREAHAQRYGKALLAQIGSAYLAGDLDAAQLGHLAFGEMLTGSSLHLEVRAHRNVDLTAYLNGTHEPLMPSVGAVRDDNLALLYAGLWHTLIAPTTSGKSWFALWHCVQEIRNGNTVVYAHFEEDSPKSTLARLRQIAPDLTDEQVAEQFIWLDCSSRWEAGEFKKALPEQFVLLVLDGINACCGMQGWVVDKPEAVGDYRRYFVTPATKRRAAVISLGHPVKNTERQNERHGYGATGWLDEVNGTAFRLVPSKKTPIGKGQLGHSTLYTVKDREGEVQRQGLLDTGEKRENWYRIGSFKVDDRPEQRNTSAWLNVPVEDDQDGSAGSDPVDKVAEDILRVLPSMGGRFEGYRALQDVLTASKVTFNKNSVGPAIQRLGTAGRLTLTKGDRGRVDGVLVPLATPDSAPRSLGQSSVEVPP
jgi:hypothetical protein